MAKKDYKLKFRDSPDYGDVTCMLPEIARRKGFRLAPIGETKTRFQDVNDLVNKAQSVYDSNTMYSEEIPEESLV